MGKNKKRKRSSCTGKECARIAERTTKKEWSNQPTATASNTVTSQQYPLAFPSHLPRPSNDFLRDVEGFQDSYQTALKTSYEGFAVDEGVAGNDETNIQQALQEMVDHQFFRTDVTQPFGLGTKCARTYVTRCVVGDKGTTYKYLGLRMFSHPWDESPSTISQLRDKLAERTHHHLRRLDQTRQKRGAPLTRGRACFDICLINRMEVSEDLKTEPTLGNAKTCVSWHADSSLEHFSTIAVYQTIVPHQSSKNGLPSAINFHDWYVALRVAHDSEGPASSRRGASIESSIITATPPIAVSLPSNSAYYLLDDFNHHHQHTVLTNSKDKLSAGVRYSCTYRLLRESHSVGYILERCRIACSNFHKKGIRVWKSEQLLLTELESEWLRQFYIQGSQHHDLLWKVSRRMMSLNYKLILSLTLV